MNTAALTPTLAVPRSLPAAPAGQQAQAPAGIGVRGLHKRYGDFVALHDVNLDVTAGEFLTLLGPSGSGKTTLLNAIAGFVPPDTGRISFGGEDVTLAPVNRRGLGVVFQNYALFPHMSVAQNVAFPLKVRRLSRTAIAERVQWVLDLVQLGPLSERSVAQLSGGQRQRVALARAVVFSPRIVLMDEPLSALDKNLREQMQVEIRHLHEKIGATTIYVTHDQREALTMSDRIAVMNKGRIVQCASPRDIYESPTDAFVAGFIGETTLLDVTACDDGRVQLDNGTPLRSSQPVPQGGPLKLVLRAERLLMPEECSAQCNRIAAVVRDVIYQGDSFLLLAEVPGTGARLSVRRPVHSHGRLAAQPAGGDTVYLGVEPEATLVVPA